MAKNLFLEESILDDLNDGLDSIEVPLSLRAFRLVEIGVALLFLIVIGRIFYLSVINSDFYKNRALINAGLIVPIPTQRGIIFDKYGKSLVKNDVVYSAVLKLPEFFKEKNNNEIFSAISDILGISVGDMENMINSVDLERQNSIMLSAQVNEDQVLKLRNLNFKSIEVQENFKRNYLDSRIFSHIVGYVGQVDSNDLKQNQHLSLTDIIGKTGIEDYYDKELRGKEGQIIYYRNAKGEIIENKFLSNNEAGNNIKLTVDGDLQSYFYSKLSDKIKEMGSPGGVGIVMNYKTGEILSLVNIPSFDNNKITIADINNSDRPLFDRAISGIYSPGSTIKPLVAFAALKEKVISPQDEIYSRGYIEVPNPYFPDKPSRFVDWKPQGWVNMYSALARSSNVYFYSLGGGLPLSEDGILKGLDGINGLGINRLKEYWQSFGLDKETGIDLPGENSGFLPDPSTKKNKNGDDWRIGDTYNVSIGQGDLLITPIELLSYISGVANYGKFYKPHLVEEISSKSSNQNINPEIIRDLSDYSDYFKEVEKGMLEAVYKSYGTAYMLNDLPMKIAAKTGTAQIQGNKKINAFFVGYLTSDSVSDNNKITMLVLVENAKEGSLNAVPVAKDVFRWYYDNRINNKVVNIQAASSTIIKN